jgi:hypothetical protein
MTVKMSEKRREAFLAALEASGNQTLAAEKAAVSRSWVCKERGLNPEFDSKVRAAIAAADARLKGAGDNRPPRGWGFLDGVELVVRGSNRRRVQIARARAGQWTARTEARFLAAAGATVNVKASCAAVGKSFGSAYAHRNRWPGFARRWDSSLDAGTDMLEESLMERAENIFAEPEPPIPEPAAPLPRMTIAEAIHLVHMQKRRMLELGRKPGRWRRPRTLDEVRPSILRKFSAIARKRGLL